MSRTAAILLHEAPLPTRAGRASRAVAGATLGVLWLALWPAALTRAEDARDACVAAHLQGQERRLAGDYAAARAQFNICSAARCPALIRDDCASMLAGIDAALPTVVFAVTTTDGRPIPAARVFVDGQLVSESTDGRPVSVAAGAHELRVEAEGRLPALERLEVAQDDRARTVTVSLASAAIAASRAAGDGVAHGTRERGLMPVYALGGSGLALLATGAVLGGMGLREKNDLKSGECKTRVCTDDDTRTGRRLYIAADVAFGAGAALGVAAVSLYFARYFHEGDDQRALAPVDAVVDARGATVRYRASF